MLQHAPTAVLELVYTDRSAREAKVTTYLPFAIAPDTAFSVGSTLAAAIAGISDAVLLRQDVRYRTKETTPDAPSVLSNVGYYLCLYYSNDVDIEPIFIPSPNPAHLETTGSFAGIRLDLSNPTVVSLADALTAALASILGPNGEPWGRVLLRGGRTL